jgi:hypothetical protein
MKVRMKGKRFAAEQIAYALTQESTGRTTSGIGARRR